MNDATKTKKILVVGASRGTGAAVVERLLAEGHEVTAFSRGGAASAHPRLRSVAGDAASPSDVARAVAGHEAVIVTLGIAENPVRVRLFGTSGTPLDIRSTGTKNVIAAMQAQGVRRLVVLSSYGVGETRELLGVSERVLFALLLRPQIVDTEMQEAAVRASGLDWVIAQPVHLTDDEVDAPAFTSLVGETEAMKVSRRSVARFLARAATTGEPVHASVALSGRRAAAAA